MGKTVREGETAQATRISTRRDLAVMFAGAGLAAEHGQGNRCASSRYMREAAEEFAGIATSDAAPCGADDISAPSR
jgi:hypothetical protein